MFSELVCQKKTFHQAACATAYCMHRMHLHDFDMCRWSKQRRRQPRPSSRRTKILLRCACQWKRSQWTVSACQWTAHMWSDQCHCRGVHFNQRMLIQPASHAVEFLINSPAPFLTNCVCSDPDAYDDDVCSVCRLSSRAGEMASRLRRPLGRLTRSLTRQDKYVDPAKAVSCHCM